MEIKILEKKYLHPKLLRPWIAKFSRSSSTNQHNLRSKWNQKYISFQSARQNIAKPSWIGLLTCDFWWRQQRTAKIISALRASVDCVYYYLRTRLGSLWWKISCESCKKKEQKFLGNKKRRAKHKKKKHKKFPYTFQHPSAKYRKSHPFVVIFSDAHDVALLHSRFQWR